MRVICLAIVMLITISLLLSIESGNQSNLGYTNPDQRTITEFPYIEDFDSAPSGGLPTGWVRQDTNGDGYYWGANGQEGYNKQMMVSYNVMSSMDDWLFSPAVQLTAGTTYSMHCNVSVSSQWSPESITFVLCSATNPLSIVATIANCPNFINTSPVTVGSEFTPSTTGNYYMGFWGHSARNMDRLYLDNVRITSTNYDVIHYPWVGTAGVARFYPGQVKDQTHQSNVMGSYQIDNMSYVPYLSSVVEWNPPITGLSNIGLSITASGGGYAGTTFYFRHELNYTPSCLAYRSDPGGSWVYVTNPGATWDNRFASVTIPAGFPEGPIRICFPNDASVTAWQGDLGIPANLQIQVIGTNVSLTWSGVTGATGYKIFRSETPNPTNWGTPIATVTDVTTYSESVLTKNFYQVTAIAP